MDVMSQMLMSQPCQFALCDIICCLRHKRCSCHSEQCSLKAGRLCDVHMLNDRYELNR